jgi:hypothetical protein
VGRKIRGAYSASTGLLTARTSRTRELAPVLLSLGVLLWMVLRWYRPGKMLGFVDLFPIFNALTLLDKTWLSWSDAFSPFGNYDLPTFSTYYLLHYILAAVAGNGLAQIIIFWFLIASGWLGVYVLGRSLGIGLPGSLLAAWTYAWNPYSQFLPGLLTGNALAAMMPWFFGIVHRAAVDASRRRMMTALAATVSLLLLPWIGSTPQFLFELVLLLAAWCAFLWRPSAAGFLAWLGKTTALCILAAAWWLAPVTAAIFGDTIAHTMKISAMAWTFANASLLNDLRFINPWTWQLSYYIPYSHGYDANVLTYAAGFWPVAVLCAVLLFPRSSYTPLVRFFGGVFVVAIFVDKGLHPPLAALNAAIYRIPGFVLLIEPIGFTIGALLSVSVAVGIAAEEICAFLRESRYRLPMVAAFGTIALVAAALSVSPMINGLVFTGLTGEVQDYVSLPRYWSDAAGYLNATRGAGSVLVLPQNTSYQMYYSWKYQGIDIIPTQLIARPVLLLGPSLDYFTDLRTEIIKERIAGMLLVHDPRVVPFLKRVGIRFVLCRGDVEYSLVIFRGARCNASFLAGYAGVRAFGPLKLYDLGTAAPPTYLQSGRYVEAANHKDLGLADVVDIPGRRAGKLVNLQMYDGAWQAVQLWPPVSLLPHGSAGWRNEWTVRKPGVVVLFNVMNAIQLGLGVVGVGIVCALIWYALRLPSREWP